MISKNGSGDGQQQYPPEFVGARPIHDQINAIADAFPGLDRTGAHRHVTELPPLPEKAEGWFAVPTYGALKRLFHPEEPEYPGDEEIILTRGVLERLNKLFWLRGYDVPPRVTSKEFNMEQLRRDLYWRKYKRWEQGLISTWERDQPVTMEHAHGWYKEVIHKTIIGQGTKENLENIKRAKQDHDIIIFPAQFGQRHIISWEGINNWD